MATPLSRFTLDKSLFNPSLYTSMLNFWFAGLPATAKSATPELAGKWFGRGKSQQDKEDFDSACRSKFRDALASLGPDRLELPTFKSIEEDRRTNYANIANPFVKEFSGVQGKDGEGKEGQGDPDAALGLILILDQIPRNIFRAEQGVIYTHYDRISRAILSSIMSFQLDGHEKYRYSVIYRMWFYLPLMHSEDLKDHELFNEIHRDMKRELQERGETESVDYLDRALEFGEKHRVILERFGRYPHRNEAVGRQMTEEERKYLDEGGDDFGTQGVQKDGVEKLV